MTVGDGWGGKVSFLQECGPSAPGDGPTRMRAALIELSELFKNKEKKRTQSSRQGWEGGRSGTGGGCSRHFCGESKSGVYV